MNSALTYKNGQCSSKTKWIDLQNSLTLLRNINTFVR